MVHSMWLLEIVIFYCTLWCLDVKIWHNLSTLNAKVFLKITRKPPIDGSKCLVSCTLCVQQCFSTTHVRLVQRPYIWWASTLLARYNSMTKKTYRSYTIRIENIMKCFTQSSSREDLISSDFVLLLCCVVMLWALHCVLNINLHLSFVNCYCKFSFLINDCDASAHFFNIFQSHSSVPIDGYFYQMVLSYIHTL
jgi:hypothetical protein